MEMLQEGAGSGAVAPRAGQWLQTQSTLVGGLVAWAVPGAVLPKVAWAARNRCLFLSILVPAPSGATLIPVTPKSLPFPQSPLSGFVVVRALGYLSSFVMFLISPALSAF